MLLFKIETSFKDIFTPNEELAKERRSSITFNRTLLRLIEEENRPDIAFIAVLRTIKKRFRTELGTSNKKTQDQYNEYIKERLPLAWAMKYDHELAAAYFSTYDEGLFAVMREKIQEYFVAEKDPENTEDEVEAPNKYEEEILSCEKKFHALLRTLKIKIDVLTEKGTPNNAKYDPRYEKVKTAAETMYERLQKAAEQFFTKSTKSPEDYTTFKKEFREAIKNARPIIKQHRGTWNNLNSTLKKLLGILLTITLIAPILVMTGVLKHGYKNTFFKQPNTDTTDKLIQFKKEGGKVLQEIQQLK